MTSPIDRDRATRDRLAEWVHDKTRTLGGDRWGWYSNDLTAAADELHELVAELVREGQAVAVAQELAEEVMRWAKVLREAPGWSRDDIAAALDARRSFVLRRIAPRTEPDQ